MATGVDGAQSVVTADDGAERDDSPVPSKEPESQELLFAVITGTDDMEDSSSRTKGKTRRHRIFSQSLVETTTCRAPNEDSVSVVNPTNPKTVVTLDLPQDLVSGLNDRPKNNENETEEASICSMSTHECTIASQSDVHSVRSSQSVMSVSRIRRSKRRASLPQGPLLPIVTEALWSTQSSIVIRGMSEVIKLINRDEDRRHRMSSSSEQSDDEKDESVKLEFIWLGGHLAVVRAMQHHATCSDVQVRGSRILFKVLKSISVYWMSLLGCMGTIRVLVSAIHRFHDNLAVQESCSRTLYRLLSCQANAEEFCGINSLTSIAYGEDGITALLKRVEQFPQDRQARIDVCNLLKKLCAFENVRRTLQESGVVSILSSGDSPNVRTCLDDQSAVSSSKTSITSITTASMSDDSEGSDGATDLNGPNTESTGRIGVQGLPVVVEHEESLPNSLCITISPGQVIRKMVEATPGSRNYWYRRRVLISTPSSQDRVVDEARITSLIEAVAIDLFDDDWEVVESALEQMDVLIHQRYDRRYSCGKILIEIGGPLALLQAMKTHLRNPCAQYMACQVMQGMNRLEGLHVLFADLQAVQVVLDGLRANPNESKVQKTSMKCLLALLKKSSSMSNSSDSNNSMQQFFQADGIAVMLQALYGFPNKTKVQIAACKILCHCVKTQPLQFTVEQDSVVTALEAILEKNANHSKVAIAANRVLEALERKTSKLWI